MALALILSWTSKMKSSLMGRGAIDLASAAAYWGQKGDFVAGLERGVPGGEFLVAGCDQRGTVPGKFRATRNKLGEEVFDARTGCQLDRFFRTAGNFFQAPEEEGLYADRRFYVGGCHAAHQGIVTRCAPRG